MQEITEAYDYVARRHTGQTRKGAAAEPYVNHVIDVANRVAQSSAGPVRELILGALMHDIIEDTTGSAEEIAARFGQEVAALVLEVTDDKSLPKEERKRRQVEHAPRRSDHARRIKLADKASNLTSLASSPPVHWDAVRTARYIDWAEAVAAGCRGVDTALEEAFDRAVAVARGSLT